jgi:hypothetical protein
MRAPILVEIGALVSDRWSQALSVLLSVDSTTSNSSRLEPDATWFERAPACASIAGPFAQAW